MIDGMPKKLPQYVFRETTRHKKKVWYFRRGKGARIRLPDYGSPEFQDAYDAALAGMAADAPKVEASGPAGSFSWLVARYRASGAYLALSPATRRQRNNILKGVKANVGNRPSTAMTRAKIIAGLEARKHTPAQARNFLQAMRGLFEWAVENAHVKDDPTAGIKTPKRPAGDGFPPWTEADVVAYERRWECGTKERVWLRVLLYTGLRRGDAVALGRQHVKDGWITIRTEKTGAEVYIPVFDELATAIKDGPTADLAFICGEMGKPLTKESFGNQFRLACNAAGLRGKSAHGVRKLAATRAAEKGLTVSELEAMFGWEGGAMAIRYTKTADRKRLARSAAEKIRNEKRPHLGRQLPAPKKNVN